jgi:hypothetical protein
VLPALSLIAENAFNIANQFNNYLCCGTGFWTPDRAFSNINFKNTSTKKIEKVIRSHKTKEFHGYDEITTRILKMCLFY